MQVQRQDVRNVAHHRRCEVADLAEIARHDAAAESDVCGAAPLECGEIPAPAIGPGFVTAKLARLTLNRTRQEPLVDLRFSQGHWSRGLASTPHSRPSRPTVGVSSVRHLPTNAVVVVDLAAILVGVVGHTRLCIAWSLLELLLLERDDVAVDWCRTSAWSTVAVAAYAKKAAELKGHVVHLPGNLVDD